MQTSWIPFIPESASTVSGKVDALYFYLSGVTAFFTLLISCVLIFFVIKYRRRTPFEIPRPIAGSHYGTLRFVANDWRAFGGGGW